MIGTSTTINQAPKDMYDFIGASQMPHGQRALNLTGNKPQKQYTRGPRYFVGVDQVCTFRERIQQLYSDNREITDAVAELDGYFSDKDFEDHPEIQHFVSWVARSIESPKMAREVAAEIVNQGYITALKRLG